MSSRIRACTLFVLAVLAQAIACASSDLVSIADAQDGGTAVVQVDETPVPVGIADDGRDPAVVALDVGGVALCSGALIAPDIVLTARHCVSTTSTQITCPATGPQVTGDLPASSLHVLLGDDVATARVVATGKVVLTPASDAICDEDIAVVVLDQAIDGILPLAVSASSVANGARVTAVGYGRRTASDAAGKKLLREHVAVQVTSPAEIVVGEATCQGDSGGPALDADGVIVGVVSRGGPACNGPGVHNVYTRVDPFRVLIAQALEKSIALQGPVSDAGAPAVHDVPGAPCDLAGDCATGVCTLGPGARYCSRACGTDDRCPAHFHCTSTPTTDGGEVKVCVAQS